MVRQRDIIQALKPRSEKPKTLCNDPDCKAYATKIFCQVDTVVQSQTDCLSMTAEKPKELCNFAVDYIKNQSDKNRNSNLQTDWY